MKKSKGKQSCSDVNWVARGHSSG